MACGDELQRGPRVVERVGQLLVLDRLVATPSTRDVTRLLIGPHDILGLRRGSIAPDRDAALAEHIAEQRGRLLESLPRRVGPVLLNLLPPRTPFMEADTDVRGQSGVGVVAPWGKIAHSPPPSLVSADRSADAAQTARPSHQPSSVILAQQCPHRPS